MFLLRAAFWLTLVILVLPAPEGGEAPRVTILEALGAVRATIADLSQFCDRNPDVCATGQSVAETVIDKARYGVEQLQAYLGGSDDAGDTLTAADLEAPWHDPGDARVASIPSR